MSTTQRLWRIVQQHQRRGQEFTYPCQTVEAIAKALGVDDA